MSNPVKTLWDEHGQAVWLDYIRRDLVAGDGLRRFIDEDGIRGVTSNPSIFAAAITGSDDYDRAVQDLLSASPGLSTDALYERLAVEDIRLAADRLSGVYEASDRGDGFVSLEVSPHLASDGQGTVEEARRLWRLVDRPNLMIKVPATAAGMSAVEALVSDGINVNVTLIFSLAHYDATVAAYLRGLESCREPERTVSVASFFISRVDTVVDARLEAIGGEDALALRGRAAVANAQRAYRRFREVFHGDAFASFRRRGARVQRPLWASTSTKNPDYPDTKYVSELVAEETVNTLPTSTIDAFRDHGTASPGLVATMADADRVCADLAELGVHLDRVTEELQVDGVAAFARSFDQLLEALGQRRAREVAS